MAFAADAAELKPEYIGPGGIERSEHALEQRLDHTVFGWREIGKTVRGRLAAPAIIGIDKGTDEIGFEHDQPTATERVHPHDIEAEEILEIICVILEPTEHDQDGFDLGSTPPTQP